MKSDGDSLKIWRKDSSIFYEKNNWCGPIMRVKPTHNLFLLLLILRSGLVNSRLLSSRQVNISLIPTSQQSRSGKAQQNGKDSAHISDFTDPDTGLNPFLDLQEGRTGAFGRRFKDQDRPLPRPYVPPVTDDDDIVEGESDSVRARVGDYGGRSRITGNPRWGSSWNDDRNRQHPAAKSDTAVRTSKQWNHQRLDFENFAETTTSAEHSILNTSTETITTTTATTITAAGTTTTLLLLYAVDSSGGSSDVDNRDVVDDEVTSSPGNPLANGVTSSSALIIIGSVVAVVALVFVSVALFAWKRLRRNRNVITTTTMTDPSAAAAAYVESKNCEGTTGYSSSSSTNGRDSKART